jgi:hypothetical protein
VSGPDDLLLQSVADLYAELDPAPGDLADGVLARLAVQDLETEFEMFTLVQAVDTTLGTRHDEPPETSASVALEFAASTYRVLVRISDTDDGGRRLDGWVVPALPMRAFLGPQGDELALWLLPQTGREGSAPPFVTPPFLV